MPILFWKSIGKSIANTFFVLVTKVLAILLPILFTFRLWIIFKIKHQTAIKMRSKEVTIDHISSFKIIFVNNLFKFWLYILLCKHLIEIGIKLFFTLQKVLVKVLPILLKLLVKVLPILFWKSIGKSIANTFLKKYW